MVVSGTAAYFTLSHSSTSLPQTECQLLRLSNRNAWSELRAEQTGYESGQERRFTICVKTKIRTLWNFRRTHILIKVDFEWVQWFLEWIRIDRQETERFHFQTGWNGAWLTAAGPFHSTAGLRDADDAQRVTERSLGAWRTVKLALLTIRSISTERPLSSVADNLTGA